MGKCSKTGTYTAARPYLSAQQLPCPPLEPAARAPHRRIAARRSKVLDYIVNGLARQLQPGITKVSGDVDCRDADSVSPNRSKPDLEKSSHRTASHARCASAQI
jgi:hypothetical protein